ncbi:MAG: glucans biosynthesis glucosyltransferase MdoH [Pseudomonadota bacterium]|nr:glucans biosynthesis glucosyltransferase MdoH [Pseudomonadota bacterium]
MLKTRPISSAQIRRRRFLIFGLMLLTTVLLTCKWVVSMPTYAPAYARIIMTFLFILTTGWIALFFWASIFGFFELLTGKNMPGIVWPDKKTPLKTKTAVLMPIYNEECDMVYARLLAIADSLVKTGQAQAYDIFVLSDTTNPKIWVEEENGWINTKKLMPKDINLYYRRRPQNVARKSGNIEDFCHKWGALYDFMIVLDADSLLEGRTLVTMSRLMEVNTDTGIIQAPPQCINSRSLFARVQQFAGRVYGRIVSAGLCYWQVHDSNYWGHNAIIRVKAFMECCGLPVLKGPKPFGGHILSHDFVEAALIRRGGWFAWLLPELGGSYEECPPTMIDFATRDRRWCQGNIQHLEILVSRYIHPISRIHFIIGIMSYLSSPLWFIFLVAGILVALGHVYFPPEYFTSEESLFPNWPVFDKFGTITLFLISMFMLIFPKFLGMIIYLKNNKFKNIGGLFGTVKSVTAEIIFSALIAPIMMVFQTKFVWEILTGQDVGWKTQSRDGCTTWKEACKRHAGHTFLGILTTYVVYTQLPALFYWMLPVTLGLMLSVPLSVLSSYESLGNFAFRHNWFVIPEEKQIPKIAAEAQKKASVLLKQSKKHGVLDLIADFHLLQIHTLMLEINGPAPEISLSVLNEARIKLDNYLNYDKEPIFSREEEIALLYHPELLEEAALELKLK